MLRTNPQTRVLEEAYVGLSTPTDPAHFAIKWGEISDVTQQLLQELGKTPAPDSDGFIYVNHLSSAFQKEAARVLKKGEILTIDYDPSKTPLRIFEGVEGRALHPHDTQAYLAKEVVGKADLTRGIDLHQVSTLGSRHGLGKVQITTQKDFLLQNGYTTDIGTNSGGLVKHWDSLPHTDTRFIRFDRTYERGIDDRFLLNAPSFHVMSQQK